jgi:hypothetical protein
MKTFFQLEKQNDVDKLTELVLSLIEESGLMVQGTGGRSKTRNKDFTTFDIQSDDGSIYGHYEYKLLGRRYQIQLEMSIPKIYDKMVARISQLYPGLLEPIGQ